MQIEEDFQLKGKFQNHFLKQYWIVQDKIQFKMPYHPNVKMAKIKEKKDQSKLGEIQYTYYYETLDCYEEIQEFNFDLKNLVPEKKQSESASSTNQQKDQKQENKTDAIIILKQLVSFIIEGYHQAANFGLYFDTAIESCLLQRENYQVLVIRPKFDEFINFCFQNNITPGKIFEGIAQYRSHQNTLQKQQQLLYTLANTISESIGIQDEDHDFFNQLKAKNFLYIDHLVTDEMIKKRYWRNSLKDSLVLYHITPALATKLEKFMYDETKLVQQKRDKNRQDNQEGNQLTQVQLWNQFMKELSFVQTDQIIDIQSDFAKKAIDKNIISPKTFREFCQPKFIPLKGVIRVELSNPEQKQDQQAPQQKVGLQQINPDVQNAGITQFKVMSRLSSFNFLNGSLNASAQSLVDVDQKLIKQLTINFKAELLETKLCYLFKTQIPEIAFQIDTADEIMYLCNMVQKQYGQTNIFIDEQRKVSMYSSVVLGQPINILGATLKVIDIHTIYFYFLLDFHAKYIAQGKTIKEYRYQQMVEELMHYVNDYENDFNVLFNDFQRWF